MSEAMDCSDDGLEEPPPPPPPRAPPKPAPADEYAVEPPFLVWLDGLPISQEFDFHTEFVLPCMEAYPDSVKDKSFLADRHDLLKAPLPAGAALHLTWGVLAFRTFESAQACGMKAAAGLLASNSMSTHRPMRVTVRQRDPAPQEQLDAVAAELQQQASINSGSLVRQAIVASEQRRAAGVLQVGSLPASVAAEAAGEASPPPPPPLPEEAPAAAAGEEEEEEEQQQQQEQPHKPERQQQEQPLHQQQQEQLQQQPLQQPQQQEQESRPAPIATRPQPASAQPGQTELLATSPRLAGPNAGSPRATTSSAGNPRGTSPRSADDGKAGAAAVLPTPDDKKRSKVRNMLVMSLEIALTEAAGAGLDASAVAAAAEAVEAALLELHGTTGKEYADRARMLSFNLKAADNEELRGHVLSGEIAPPVLVKMTSEQLASKNLQRWRQSVRQESLRQAVLPPEVAAQISTAAAVQMKKEGRLGSQQQGGGYGVSALLADHSLSPPEDHPLEEVVAAAADGSMPSCPIETASGQHVSPSAAIPGLESVEVTAVAEGAGGSGGEGWQPPPPLRTMPTYRLGTVSPAASGEHGGSPTAAATAGLWDEAELGIADVPAGERGGTPDVEPPSQLDAEEQRSPTPDVEPPAAERAPQQQQQTGTPVVAQGRQDGPQQQVKQEGPERAATPDVDDSEDEAEQGGTPDAAAGAAAAAAAGQQADRETSFEPESTPDVDAVALGGKPEAHLLGPQQSAQHPLQPQQLLQEDKGGGQRQPSSGGAAKQPQRGRGVRDDERQRYRGGAAKAGKERNGRDAARQRGRSRSGSRERRSRKHGSSERRRSSTAGRDEQPERWGGSREAEGRDDRSRKDGTGSRRRSREAEEGRRRQEEKRPEEAGKQKRRDGGSKHGSQRQKEGGSKHSSKHWAESSKRRDSDEKRREGSGKRELERRSSREDVRGERQQRDERGGTPRKDRPPGKHRSPQRLPGRHSSERGELKRSRSRSPRERRGSPSDLWQAVAKRSKQEQPRPPPQQQQQRRSRLSQLPPSATEEELEMLLDELERQGPPQPAPQAAAGLEQPSADALEDDGHGTPDIDAGEPDGPPDFQPAGEQLPPQHEHEHEQQQQQHHNSGWAGGLPAATVSYADPIAAGWTYVSEQQQIAAGYQKQQRLRWPEQQQQLHDRQHESGDWQQPQWQAVQPDWQQQQHQQQRRDWHRQQSGWQVEQHRLRDQQQHQQRQPQAGWPQPQHGAWSQAPLQQLSHHAWWRGQLDWPQGSNPTLELPAAAEQWMPPSNSELPRPRLPGRLPVQSTMDGSSLMPLLEGLGVPPGKVCCFLLAVQDGARLAATPALQAGKVGCCLVDLEGRDVLEAEAWTPGREHRGWMLHLLAPTDQVLFFLGIHRAEVDMLGPGALLVLALPVWHGWFYTSDASYQEHKPLAAVRMLGPPLVHQLDPRLVARHRMHTDMWQFQAHRRELEAQKLLVKARRQPADQQALAETCQELRKIGRCFAVQLGQVAEMLLMPCHDGRHLQAAVWQPDMGQEHDRTVFDPWALRI